MSKLHIDSITKSFGSKKILQDVYLSIKTGEIAGLLGRNGEGKSTLLEIIFGTVKGDTQFVKIDQKILQTQADRKNNIAYLPQHFFLPRNVKIKNLIPLFCTKQNTEKLFNLDLMKTFLHKAPGKLSGGEKKITEALLILYSNSKFILLDEPFNGLSPKMTSEIQKIIKEQAEQKGIIISDHRFQEVAAISDSMYLLSDTVLRPVKDLEELKQYNYLPKSI
ncbi:ATP-binding cassette domain-containing protein [Chryseobacterium daeguense]|uniref:ATP-binding cassette domain-containing protein n=1 Tax=Chryseobacterium daeguense TaxID=412438 RepID=UPI00040B81E8|nr:ATP-binding cassette domain-containing protein [Chryseobacterium daeguense]